MTFELPIALLANLVEGQPGWRRHVPPALYLLALTALAVAVARPHVERMVPREQATVVLVLDVSGSMLSEDVDPTRLEAARRAANDFLDRLPETYRVGLVSFATEAQTLVTPTRDRETVRSSLAELTANGGTAVGDAVDRALAAVGADKEQRAAVDPSAPSERVPAVVVLLSDGATSSGRDPLEAARDAGRAQVPVNTVALGTQQGFVDLPDELGNLQRIPVPPDPDTLRAVARLSGGRFFEAPSAEQLQQVYRDLGSRVGREPEQTEISAAFAAGGLVLMLLGGALSLHWFSRLP